MKSKREIRCKCDTIDQSSPSRMKLDTWLNKLNKSSLLQPIFHHGEAITSGCKPPTNQALKGNYQLPRRQHSDEVCEVEQSQTIVSLRHSADLHSFSISNKQHFHSLRVVSRAYIKFAESGLDDDDKKCSSTHERSKERREQSRNEKREVFRPAVRRIKMKICWIGHAKLLGRIKRRRRRRLFWSAQPQTFVEREFE